jgi:4-hydroxyacetophenone monooxygenase
MPPVTWQPFTVSDDDLAQRLGDLSVPTLLLSCVHITGDLSILDGPHQPHGLMANEEQGFMSPEEPSAARAFALELIKDYRDPGVPTAETDSGRGIATDDELGRVRAD